MRVEYFSGLSFARFSLHLVLAMQRFEVGVLVCLVLFSLRPGFMLFLDLLRDYPRFIFPLLFPGFSVFSFLFAQGECVSGGASRGLPCCCCSAASGASRCPC